MSPNTACLTCLHDCRLEIASPRPRPVCARADNVPDNDHTASTTPLLLQQRRSAGYFAYPSRLASPPAIVRPRPPLNAAPPTDRALP